MRATACTPRLCAPGELRKAQWPEFDLDKAEWRIPAERMKMAEQHIVPLSDQAVEILRELEPLTNREFPSKPNAPRYVFPGARSRTTNERKRHTGSVAANGLHERRDDRARLSSMASTVLHEQGWNHHAIERQLAHAERNSVTAAYNFAEHLPERRKMMQWWADYLDRLKGGVEVIPLFKNA